MYNLLCRLKVSKYLKTADNILKYTKTCPIRQLSSTTSKIKNQQEVKTTDAHVTWNRIYYFPHIRLAALLNRFKLYQTTFTIASVPISTAMYSYGMLEIDAVGIITGCAFLASATLYVMTGYFKRLIGIIAITDDDKVVKISHLTFWGRKNEISVPLKDIVPLSDCDCNANDVYVKVKRYSSDDYLYLTLKFGKIMDKSKFELVFGSLDVIGFKK